MTWFLNSARRYSNSNELHYTKHPFYFPMGALRQKKDDEHRSKKLVGTQKLQNPINIPLATQRICNKYFLSSVFWSKQLRLQWNSFVWSATWSIISQLGVSVRQINDQWYAEKAIAVLQLNSKLYDRSCRLTKAYDGTECIQFTRFTRHPKDLSHKSFFYSYVQRLYDTPCDKQTKHWRKISRWFAT